ncbi:MAG: hypothetical protein KA190_01085 [Kofleriaceae bacterium]|nr:hypothetical protein [Kofleriaceae bacterium]
MLPWPVSRAVLPAILAAGAAVACAQPTGLVLHLDVPDDSTLAPDSAATVTIEARRAGAAPITITAPLDGASFDLGDLPVGEVTSLRALLRGDNDRLVGYGVATAPVIVGEVADVTVPVRRPMVYLAGPSNRLATMDPTRDRADYQGQVPTSFTPGLVAAIGGEEVAVADGDQIRLLRTSDHQFAESTIALPGPARTAAASRDGRVAVYGHGGASPGFVVIDRASGARSDVTTTTPPDRVAVSEDGATIAVLLAACAQTPCAPSSVVVTTAAAPSADDVRVVGPVVDLAVSASGRVLLAPADRSAVDELDGDVVELVQIDNRRALAPPWRARRLAVHGEVVWAVGVEPFFVDPGPTGSPFDNVEVAPAVRVARIELTDGGAGAVRVIDAFDYGEALVTASVEGQTVFQELGANPVVVDGIAVGPLGDQLAIVLHGDFASESVTDGIDVLIPAMTGRSAYYLLVSDSGSVVQRVRTRCEVSFEAGGLADWSCRNRAEIDAPVGGAYTPSSATILFGTP